MKGGEDAEEESPNAVLAADAAGCPNTNVVGGEAGEGSPNANAAGADEVADGTTPPKFDPADG